MIYRRLYVYFIGAECIGYASEAIDQWQPAPYRTTVQAVISSTSRLRTGLHGLAVQTQAAGT